MNLTAITLQYYVFGLKLSTQCFSFTFKLIIKILVI